MPQADNPFSTLKHASPIADFPTSILDNLATLMVSSDQNVRSSAFDLFVQLVQQQPEAIEELIDRASPSGEA